MQSVLENYIKVLDETNAMVSKKDITFDVVYKI